MNVIWIEWKTLLKSGLKHYGSPLPLLDKPICGLWETTKPYNCPKPCLFRLVPKWSEDFQKLLFGDHNTLIINTKWLSVHVSPCLSCIFGNTYKYRECGWTHRTPTLYSSNHFKHWYHFSSSLLPPLPFCLWLPLKDQPLSNPQNEKNADGENTHCCVITCTVEAIERAVPLGK